MFTSVWFPYSNKLTAFLSKQTGAFSDYVTFIWAELIVAVSAVVSVWHWVLLMHPKSES